MKKNARQKKDGELSDARASELLFVAQSIIFSSDLNIGRFVEQKKFFYPFFCMQKWVRWNQQCWKWVKWVKRQYYHQSLAHSCESGG